MIQMNATSLLAARELLKQWPFPSLLRSYGATVDDYFSIADEDLKCEYVDGELIVHSPATATHEALVMFIGMLLRVHAGRHGGGTVFGSNVVMQLSAERYFCPDLSFLSRANESRIRDERVVGPMDLVVEVLSKSTRRYDRGDKLAAYQEGRVPEIWLVDPDEQRFEAYVLGGDAYERQELSTGRYMHRLEAGAALTGETPVPHMTGFSIDVAWLWRRPLPTLDECRGA